MIDASSDFVCIRLATYEDEEEAKFLKEIFVGRSGELENTVFCLLAPDGKTQLSRPGRGPQFAFRTPGKMAAEMTTLAKEYEVEKSDTAPALPQMKDFRLSLNVAECDALPLVICVADDDEQLTSLQQKISPLAFSDSLAGRFTFASVTDRKELSVLEGEKPEGTGFLIVAPDEYGQKGVIQKQIDGEVNVEALTEQLASFATEYQRRAKDHRDHVSKGKDAGVDWKSEIPVTDPMSNRARDRRGSGEESGKGSGRRRPPPGSRKGKGRRPPRGDG